MVLRQASTAFAQTSTASVPSSFEDIVLQRGDVDVNIIKKNWITFQNKKIYLLHFEGVRTVPHVGLHSGSYSLICY